MRGRSIGSIRLEPRRTMRTVAEWFVLRLAATTQIALITVPPRTVTGDAHQTKTTDRTVDSQGKPHIRPGRAGLGFLDNVVSVYLGCV